ncbi:MAG: iron-containing alcohol dehydrogenase [Calditerrivibrio sp.]|nr:iron-containing alcohol dehydrogenase [Calditerrivibrio sp.]
MFNAFFFHCPVKVHVERDPYEVLTNFLKDCKRVGVVSGKRAIFVTGFSDFLVDRFREHDIYFFNEVNENPTINEVLKAGRFLKDNKVEKVIAFGGGSALDAGKAAAIFATNNVPFYELLNAEKYNMPLPLIAIPTTCGTGSEVNHYSIITDLEKLDKVNFNKPFTFPKEAILWSEFIKTLDKQIMLYTVYDAFTHAFEGFVSKRSNKFSDIVAKEAMYIILKNLKSVCEGRDCDIKELLFASSLAGVVILHTGTTVLHALGYYLTNVHRVQHGLANLSLLTKYIKMCEDSNIEKLKLLRLLEKEVGITVEESVQEIFGGIVANVFERVDVEKMVEYAIKKPNALSTPFEVDKNYILEHLV